MALNIIVDGYNFIRCTPLVAAERQGLEEGRDALCQWFADLRRARGHDITIVFDGDLSATPTRIGGVKVEFAPSADAAVVALSRSGVFVVSSDRAVQRAAEKAGAVACSSEEFWRHAGPLAAAADDAAAKAAATAAATATDEIAAEAELEEDWTRGLDDPRLWALANGDGDGGFSRGGQRQTKRGRRLSKQESRRRSYLERL